MSFFGVFFFPSCKSALLNICTDAALGDIENLCYDLCFPLNIAHHKSWGTTVNHARKYDYCHSAGVFIYLCCLITCGLAETAINSITKSFSARNCF